MKRHSQAEDITTDRFASYKAALRELGATDKQQTGRWLDNRVVRTPIFPCDDENWRCSASDA